MQTVSAMLKSKATIRHMPCKSLPDGVVIVHEVTRKTFKRHVETSDYFTASDMLGYERYYQKGETLAGSSSVTFHRGTYDGAKCWVLHDSYHGYMVFKLSEHAIAWNKQYC